MRDPLEFARVVERIAGPAFIVANYGQSVKHRATGAVADMLTIDMTDAEISARVDSIRD